MESSTITAPGEPIAAPETPRPRGMIAGLAVLALLWFVLCRHLSGEWSINEQYSYGWFVPFFALFLFWLRWEDRPRAFGANVERRTSSTDHRTAAAVYDRRRTSTLAIIAATLLLWLLLPIRLFEIGNPDWRPLAWLHACAVVSLTLLLIWTVGGRPWLRHFAFPVLFVLVAVPWITPIEAPIVQGLMSSVAAVATETLHLFGIPAQLEGSLIRVSTGLVGVNEACSGVRSLQTSLMIGLLFGELKRLSVSRRLWLIAGALAIALVANFGRAFTLVWISATDSPAAADRWHDGLGYAIVGVVFLGSILLAAWLGRKGERRPTKLDGETAGKDSDSDNRPSARLPNFAWRIPPAAFVGALLWLIAVEAGVEAWYRAHERDLVPREQWTVRYPEEAPAFRQIDIDDDVQRTLRYDEGRQVAWTAPLPGSSESPGATSLLKRASAYLFFFRWEPGTSTILRARSHRPDVCLPNVGWRQTGDHGVRDYSLGRPGASLGFRHFEFVREVPGQRPSYAHSFFCMSEDKIRKNAAGMDPVGGTLDKLQHSERLRVVREGLRNPGQQVVQLVLTAPVEITPAQAEAEFQELLPKIVVVNEGEKPKG